jgi:hypothetical protein
MPAPTKEILHYFTSLHLHQKFSILHIQHSIDKEFIIALIF